MIEGKGRNVWKGGREVLKGRGGNELWEGEGKGRIEGKGRNVWRGGGEVLSGRGGKWLAEGKGRKGVIVGEGEYCEGAC